MLRILLRVVAILAIVFGIGMFLIAVTAGDCAAFGGTCPRTTSTVADDVIGMSATAGALVGAGIVFVAHPALQSWWRALVVAIPTALVAAVVAHTSTSS